MVTRTYDLLSKLHRRKTALEFRQSHIRNRLRWLPNGLGEGVGGQQLADLTWQLIDVQARIRDLEYRHPDGNGEAPRSSLGRRYVEVASGPHYDAEVGSWA